MSRKRPSVYLFWGDSLWSEDGPIKTVARFSFLTDWRPSKSQTFRDVPETVIRKEAAGGISAGNALQLKELPEPIPPGMTIVVGEAGTGKSRFMGALARASSGVLISYGEPTAESDRPHLPLLCHRLGEGFGRSDTVLLDSLKSFLITASGNLGAGGLSKEVLSLIDDLAAASSKAGYHLIASVNPFDVTDVDRFVLSYAATSTALIRLASADATHVSGRMTSRAASRQYTDFRFAVVAASPSSPLSEVFPSIPLKPRSTAQ